MQSVRSAWAEQWREIRSLPFKPVFVLLTATVFQVVARFHTSRFAFRALASGMTTDPSRQELYEYCLWLIGDFLLQFPLLLLLVRLILKDAAAGYGLKLGEFRLGLKVSLVFWMCMLPVLWFVSGSAAFQHIHPAPGLAKTEWMAFWLYECCSILYIIGWEFIWRGYVLFGLKEYVGYYAVFIQMIPFALLHLGSPELETYAAIVAGVGLGMLAFATRSFWYGALAHMLVLGTMDMLGALRIRAANSGTGFHDLLEVFARLF